MSESSTSDHKLKKATASYHAQEPDLELPIQPEFASKSPQLSPTEMHQWCEEMMALGFASLQGDRPAERLATKCRVEFVL